MSYSLVVFDVARGTWIDAADRLRIPTLRRVHLKQIARRRCGAVFRDVWPTGDWQVSSEFDEIAAVVHLPPHRQMGGFDKPVYFGRGPEILAQRHRFKRATIANRRLLHQMQAA